MEEIKKWIKKAEKDISTAKYNLNGGELEAGLFFCQQAAEKSLKAVYIKKFKSLFRTHDLIILGKKINAPKEILEFCKKINPAYGYTRYPDISPEEKFDDDPAKILNYSMRILEWAKKNL